MLKQSFPLVLTLGLGLSAAGCGGPSPEAEIACGGTGSVTVDAAGDYRTRVIQTVTTDDPAAGGTAPLNAAEATIYFDIENVDFDQIGVCAGGYEDCVAATDYKNTVTTETNDQGVLEYFIRLVVFPGQSYSGSFYQAFGSATSTCTVGFTASAPDPA